MVEVVEPVSEGPEDEVLDHVTPVVGGLDLVVALCVVVPALVVPGEGVTGLVIPGVEELGHGALVVEVLGFAILEEEFVLQETAGIYAGRAELIVVLVELSGTDFQRWTSPWVAVATEVDVE